MLMCVQARAADHLRRMQVLGRSSGVPSHLAAWRSDRARFATDDRDDCQQCPTPSLLLSAGRMRSCTYNARDAHATMARVARQSVATRRPARARAG